MKRLVDIEKQLEIGFVDWEFLYDMQVEAPERSCSDLIRLDREFIALIPDKWRKWRDLLEPALHPEKPVNIAIADVEKDGNDFKVRGRLVSWEDVPLPFFKVHVMDRDHVEDDFIGSTLTHPDGSFSLSFDDDTFGDIRPLRKPYMPDIYLRIFRWDGNDFTIVTERDIQPPKVTRYEDKKTLIELGTIKV